jgi:hypothetical protein
MKAFMESRGIALLLFNFSARCRKVVNFTLWPLNLYRKYPWYSLNSRMCGPQSQFRPFAEEKNLLFLPGIELHIIQPIA